MAKVTKESLEELYESMSLGQMAEHLDMAKSTLYYHMRKLGVERRSKSEAQKRHLENVPHQRTGKKHSEEAREKISAGTRKFWDSEEGTEQKQRLGELRKVEWDGHSSKHRSSILKRLQTADRPSPGELSKFGKKLVAFLESREEVRVGVKLTSDHISDIVLDEHKIVIELLLPVSVYGDDQKQKVENRYDRLVSQLNDVGYRVVVIEDRSNSISLARCQRVYDKLLKFFENKSLQQLTFTS